MQRLTTRVVPPEGPLDALTCYIGQAPGKEEDEQGKPFVGQAGGLLNRCFRQKGISRSSVLIWNIFQQRPPRNNVGYYFQDKGKTKLTWEGEEHVERLRTWLETLKQRRSTGLGGPNCIVAFGREAMLVLTGKKRIYKWRGSLLPCTLVPGFKVYPTLHPSHVNRLINEPTERLFGEKKKQQQNALPLLLIDLDRIKIQSEFPEIRYPKRKFDVDLSLGEIKARLSKLASMKEGTVSVDIETLKGESGPILWMISFAPSPEYAFAIFLLKGWRAAWSLAEEIELWILISRVFLNPNLKKVFQGGMYDLSILGRYYGLRVANGTYEDTMLCHHASYPYLRKALEVLASLYTWEPYYKDEGKVHMGKRSSDSGEAIYCCKDSSVTREILPVVHRDARELGTWDGYQRTLSVVPSLLGMMIRGVLIDLPKKEKLNKKFREKAQGHKEAFEKITGITTNLDSPDQIKRILYGYYDMEIQYDHKTKKPTTDKSAIEKLRQKAKGEQAEILDHLKGFKRFDKLASTYADMQVDEDGRIHTSYGFISTYRLNSSESPFGGGGNLQNIPVHGEEGLAIRSLFIPDPGKIMFTADYDRAEAWIIAFEAEDPELMHQLKNGIDIHWVLAKKLFHIPDSVPYHKEAIFKSPVTKFNNTLYEYRTVAKNIRFAGAYGQGPYMLQKVLANGSFYFEIALCKKLIAEFKRNSPFIMAWQRHKREELKATRTLISAYGRKRYFMGRVNDNLFRAGYAFSPQNTVGEMTEVAIQRIWEELPYIDPLLNVHDEIVFQTNPENEERAIKEVRSIMEEELTIKRRTFTIPVGFRKGPSWGELEDI